MLHLRDRTDDGLVGRSRLSRAADTVAGVAASNEFARSFTRWQTHQIAITTGVLDADEVRQVEGWNPRAKPAKPEEVPAA